MALLVEAPVAVESTVPTDLTRKQQKERPYKIKISLVIQKLTLLLEK